jgi:hypothetical protein
MLGAMVNLNHWMEYFGYATCADLGHLACPHDAVYVQSQV